jgi:hypothetical protein
MVRSVNGRRRQDMRTEYNADGSLPAPCVDILMVVSISGSHYIERVAG